MNCHYVGEYDVCENYLTDRLDVPGRVVFERHCLECPECFGKLASVSSLLTLIERRRPEDCDC